MDKKVRGPEHSSARIERFLTLCAKDNIFVTYPTTPSQYFHLLRRQICNRIDKPLIVFTPKSLLRLPEAKSGIKEFTENMFSEVIDDLEVEEKNNIKRLIITSGKVYYDLHSQRKQLKLEDTAIIRIEQIYPFPHNKLKKLIQSYKSVEEICFVQEEPKNMGIWNFVHPLLNAIVKNIEIKFVGRDESPSPASGSSKLHFIMQERIVREALGMKPNN